MLDEIANFLDLTVFDGMNEFSKKESAALKQQAQTLNKGDWNKQINIKSTSIKNIEALISEEESKLSELKEDYELQGFNENSEEFLAKYINAFYLFESEFEI